MRWVMIERLIRVFTGIFLCSVTGSVLFLYWKTISRYLEKKGDVKLNYSILKIILISFFIPVLSVIFEGISQESYLFSTTGVIIKITDTVGIVWILGAAASGCFYFIKYWRLKAALKNACICSRQIHSTADLCRKELDIRREIHIYQSYQVPVPFICGVFRPKIILPEEHYTDKELKIILLHELEHYKQKDIFWKLLCNIMACIHWFNPLKKEICSQMEDWSEVNCDVRVLQVFGSLKQYFSTIISIATRKSGYRQYLASALYENTRGLELRIRRTASIRKMKGIPWKSAQIFFICFCTLGAATISAAAYGYYRGYLYLQDATSVKIQEEVDPPKIMKEKRRAGTSAVIQKVMKGEVPGKEEDILFDWQPEPQEFLISRKFWVQEGEKIQIMMMTSEDQGTEVKNDEVLVGIVEPDGIQRYVSNAIDLEYTFKIGKSGNYSIFVENRTNKKLQVAGVCSLLHKASAPKG